MAIKVSNGTQVFEVEDSRLSEAQKDGFVPTIKVSKGEQSFDVHPDKLELAKKDGFTPSEENQSIINSVVEPIATAIDYTYAPIRQAIAAPAKFARGQFADAVLDPFTQFAKHPSKAPTSSEVAEMYGVPREKKVAPIVQGNPLYGSTYEQNPMEDDPDTVTIRPSQQAGALIDASVGGEGINLATKGISKIAQGVSAGTDLAKDYLQARQAVKTAQSQSAGAAAQGSSKAGAAVSGGDLSIEQSGKLFDFKAPQSLDELNKWKPSFSGGELVGKKRLTEIENILPDIQTKPLKYHYSMMENPKAMKELKLKFENLPTNSAKKIAAYNHEIVEESAKKIRDTITEISGSQPRHISDAGEDFMSLVKEKYDAEKAALGPVFQQLQKSPRLPRAETMGLAQAIGENSKLGKLMSVGEDGKIFLQKNTPRTGLSDQEYSVLSRVIEDMNDGMTFKEIQDTREFLRKAVDPTNPGASSEVMKVRSIMLGQLEQMAERQGVSVAETFKRYAVNERTRESLEKIIGGRVENLDAMFAANPDKVVKKIFSNPNHAKVVKDYIGEEKANELIAAYIDSGISKAYDKAKGFQPHEVRSWLKQNQQFLRSNVNPETTERLQALADYGYFGRRFLDEVNPSGTAASFKEMIEPGGFVNSIKQKGFMAGVTSETVNKVEAAVKQRQSVKTVNELLGTKAPTFGERVQANLKNAPGMKEIAEKSTATARTTAVTRGLNGEAGVLQKSAEKDQPKGGSEKWASDGISNLKKHDPNLINERVLEKLKTKGRHLLYEAQSAKPGSEKMKQIIEKIKSSYLNGGE